MERGYVKLWRKTLDSGLLTNPTAWQLFGYLLLSATRKPHKVIVAGSTIELAPGEIVTRRRKISEDLNISEQSVRTAISLLKANQVITTKATNKYTIISLVNWDVYQENAPADQPTESTINNQELTSKQPAYLNKNRENINTPPYPPSSGEEGGECESAESPVVEEKQGKPKRKASAPTGYSAEFEAAWSAYPRKVGKGAAWKAWQKCEIPADICDRIKWRKLDDDWQRDGGRFVPHMATWLNRAGWEDEGCKVVHAEPQETPAQIARRAEILAEYQPMIEYYKARGEWQNQYAVQHVMEDMLADEGLL